LSSAADRDVVDGAVGAPHRPIAVVALVGQQLSIGLRGQIGDPQVGRVAAAIVLARPDGGMPVEDERFGCPAKSCPSSPNRPGAAAPARRRPHLIERGDIGERAVAVRGAGTPRSASRASTPPHRRSRCGTSTAARAPGGGDDEDVVVAVAIGGKGESSDVRRKARYTSWPRLSVRRWGAVPSSLAVQMSPR